MTTPTPAQIETAEALGAMLKWADSAFAPVVRARKALIKLSDEAALSAAAQTTTPAQIEAFRTIEEKAQRALDALDENCATIHACRDIVTICDKQLTAAAIRKSKEKP